MSPRARGGRAATGRPSARRRTCRPGGGGSADERLIGLLVAVGLAVACKHRRSGLAGSAVGTPDLQILNGTARQVHGADAAVIVTNGRVTAPAVAFAEQQRLHVVDRHTLGVWASGSRPLWELLRAAPQTDRPVLSGPQPQPVTESFGLAPRISVLRRERAERAGASRAGGSGARGDRGSLEKPA